MTSSSKLGGRATTIAKKLGPAKYDANLYIMLGLSNWKMQLNLIS